MPTITLSVPQELKKEMDKTKFVNWSEVAREAIKEKVLQLKVLDSIMKKISVLILMMALVVTVSAGEVMVVGDYDLFSGGVLKLKSSENGALGDSIYPSENL